MKNGDKKSARNKKDTTVKKIDSRFSPEGKDGEKYLAGGKRVSMRLWHEEPKGEKEPSKRDYETVGYVVSGKAELETEGQTVVLQEGDSWVVPAGAKHHYTIIEKFTAIEATSPPFEVHGRDSRNS
ncbi:MAG: cupin domain-containing protein [Candidatus Melainabacteria bacterium]|nr:cupin domain-containing protein [Candidatus Melainabacteria bacterium]